MRQRAVDEVGEHGLDDGVATVGDIGVGGRFLRVGEEGVIPPDREQRVGVE
jgi:hypothetical protein